ncbi:hypothetical protein ECG_09894 [Echinococcus granulosus]|nr:hypothetical protein ECG_09894 [Echinococcus granulosus]
MLAGDFCTLLSQQIDIPKERSLPFFICISSVGFGGAQEDIFLATIPSLLSGPAYGGQATSSLLIAAVRPAKQYMAHLTSPLHRSAGQHKICTLDLTDSFLDSSVTESGEHLYNYLQKRVTNFIDSAGKGRKIFVFLDDLAALTDLNVPSNRLLGSLLVSNLHCLVVGYRGHVDFDSDDFLLHLARRRAEFCLDVTTFDNRYSDSIEGQLIISQKNQEHNEDRPIKPTKFLFRVVDRRIQCYYPGASSLLFGMMNLKDLSYLGKRYKSKRWRGLGIKIYLLAA